MIHVETNAAEIARALQRYAEAVPRVVSSVLRTWVAIAADAARVKAPVDTGGLAGSIHGVPPFTELEPDAMVVAGKEYAPPVEFGSAEHNIVPRRRRFLRFPHRDGGWCFSKMVTIPEQDPQPFFFDSIAEQLPELNSMTDDALSLLADRVGLDDR